MTNQIDHIVQHLFNKKRLDDVSVYELERFTATHPYFAAGHFLLAKKSQLSGSDNSKEKLATAALYYHNPLWLQWLLDQEYNGTSHDTELAEGEPVPGRSETIQRVTADEFFSVTEPDDEIAAEATEPAMSENAGHTPSSEALEENAWVPSAEAHQPKPVDAMPDDTIATIYAEQPGSEGDRQSDYGGNEIIAANEAGKETGDIQDAGFERSHHLETSGTSDQSALIQTNAPEAGPQVPEEEPDNTDETAQQGNHREEEESRAAATSIEKTLSGAALIPTKAEIDKDDLTFEPYHTIDYFASQGIKLQQADLSKDKFGKQLKSFTEWLRSMKRLPNAAVDASLDEATQRSIQQIAEHSFEEKEVVTETMAEVWIKQGNKEKAIDTLYKLSLLNPSKSHYFAAKIEQLKAS